MNYTLIISVFGEEDEGLISVNEVSETDLEVIQPLLEDLRFHQGYYPTGTFIRPDRPTARDLYRHHSGWDVFNSLIPHPKSGIYTILNVKLFPSEPLKMEML